MKKDYPTLSKPLGQVRITKQQSFLLQKLQRLAYPMSQDDLVRTALDDLFLKHREILEAHGAPSWERESFVLEFIPKQEDE